MNRSIPMEALGGFFVLAGVALFAFAFKKPADLKVSSPPKKGELRAAAERHKESGKLRIAGLLFFVFGVAMMLIF